MKKIVIAAILCVCFNSKVFSQKVASILGTVVVSTTEKPLKNVRITINNTAIALQTALDGSFYIKNIPLGNYVLVVSLDGFETLKLPISILEKSTINVGNLFLSPSTPVFNDTSVIALSDDDLLTGGDQNSDYIAGLFQSSKDTYLKAAAFNFSQAWYKVRGYDSSYGTISINGIEMNKLYDGRPQWSNWGGLNDAFRNQDFTHGLAPSDINFGGVLGITNFNTRASDYQKVTKVSLSSTNKSYTGRIMATHASGITKNNWAFVISSSRRIADEGYLDGTSYNAWATFLAVEKKLNTNNSLNLTAFITPNKRGKSSPNTQEVYDLKGYKYNAFWGMQEGDKRNARIKEIIEPVLMLTHFYNKQNTTLKTTLAYQFGKVTNSRLGYFNAQNPDPTYWRYLPSNYLRFSDNLDYGNAYLAEQQFLQNGQIDWNNMYQMNANNGSSLYYLYEDRVDDSQISFNTNLSLKLTKNLNLNTGINFKSLTSQNYGNMVDLLGGEGFVDLDQYAEGEAQQNDLNNPNNFIGVGDKFQYNYTVNATVSSAFAQLQLTKRKLDYFAGITFKNTNYQRNGLFKNGTYATNSYGKSEKLSFTDFGLKSGFTYKFTGRHLLTLNSAFITKAPTIRNTFSNARVNNNSTPNITSEKIFTSDVSYVFRSPKLQSRITIYYTKFTNAIETSFFFAEGLLGDQADFVNEIITGVEKLNIGAELSVEYQLTPTIKLLVAGGFGQFTYNNNPQLYIQSESFTNENSNFGTSYLKNYHLSGTPQRAYSLGFEYRDPNFWWFQASANFLSNNYIAISPLLRTDNFFTDADGVPFIDDETGVQVTQNQINSLLVQEKFDDALLVNLVGGKSWLINHKYIGFFLGINNVLGELFKTGGFEQSRNANYPELKQDSQLNKPIFGPKYWYGNNTTYYLNAYIRF
jgi:hypothetical protein